MTNFDAARAEVAANLGVRIVETTPLRGGHTGQLVQRLDLEDGRSVVLKAAKRWAASGGIGEFALRGEIELYRKLPTLTRWRPAQLASFETDEWLGLVMENVDQPGRRQPPWSSADAKAIAAGLADIHAQTLGGTQPSGVLGVGPHDDWSRACEEGDLSSEWRRWTRDAASSASAAIARGKTSESPRCVTHGDVYPDNIFLVGGNLYLIDWAQVGWTLPVRDGISWSLAAETWSGIEAPSAFRTYEHHVGAQPPQDWLAELASVTGTRVLGLGREPRGTDFHRYLVGRLDPAAKWLAEVLALDPPPALGTSEGDA